MKAGCEGSKSMSKQRSSDSWQYKKEGIFEIFPAGLRVLVVDDDRVCLFILEKMLKACLYQVTKKDRAEDALSLLREKKNGFDIIISDVHMPEMDGFTLLEHVGLETDLPVIMMSADDDKNVVMKGVTHGACDYLIKPVRIEALRNIWQHVLRKRKNELMELNLSRSGEEGKRRQRSTNEAGNSSEGSCRNSKRNKDKDKDEDDTSSLKKPRVVWSVELHQQFVGAVNQLGLEKAVPKRILELMHVPGLTRENVASHLQKYRLFLRRVGDRSRVPRHSSALIINSEEANVGSVNSLNGLDLQISSQNLETLVATGQISAQELATALGRSTTKSALYQTDQRNLFSLERFEEEEEEEKHQNSNSKPLDLLHGIPTSMVPTQFANICQPFDPSSSQSSGVLMQITQQLSRLRVLNGASTSHVSRPILLHDVLARNNPAPQMNQSTILSSNSFLFGSGSVTSKGLVQNEVNTEMKVPRRLIPSYDIFNELNQHKSQEWSSRNQISSYNNSSQHANKQGTVAVLPSVLVNQGFISTRQNKNSSIGGPLNAPHIGQQLNTFHVGNSVRVKAESVPESSYQNTLYLHHLDQEDLLTALLKQQQGGVGEQEEIGELEGEFGFMGFTLNDLPM